MNIWLYLRTLVANPRLLLLARSRPFKVFYRELVNTAATIDPKAIVGGLWEEMGRLQFDFLIGQGLNEEHKLLDIGCGSLRGGIHFIRFLNDSNYYGVDISANILKAAEAVLVEEALVGKVPTLMINKDLKFEELRGSRFDYVLAQSVFSHMPASDIEECLQNVHKVLADHAVFFATYLDGESQAYRRGLFGQHFYYPVSFFEELGEKSGYVVSQIADYHHPTGQKMLKITRKANGSPSGPGLRHC